MEELWNFGLEKPLNGKTSVGCSLGDCKIRMLRAVQKWRPGLTSFRGKFKDY